MSSIREPGLGPIIGHTTDRTCRLWIRAADTGDEGAELASERRTIGILAVLAKDGEEIAEPPSYYFRLHREFDRTGTFNLGEDVSLNDTGNVYVGMWDSMSLESEMLPFPWYEFVQLLEGEVTITVRDGLTHQFSAGDAFFIPKGTVCSWKIQGYVKKLYSILDI